MFDRDNWHILLKVYIFIKVVFFYINSDFTTSTEFDELWNQLSEEMENQPKTVFSVLKETPCPQNTEDVEKKPSVLKTLLQNSTPTTKTTTTTVSTSSKKHKVPVFSTPVVSEENDHKISEVPFKR